MQACLFQHAFSAYTLHSGIIRTLKYDYSLMRKQPFS